jgi:hypothetical protein
MNEINLNNKAEVYSHQCSCECGCRYFCRPIDNGSCRYCQKNFHAIYDHDFGGDKLNCAFCNMPFQYADYFTKCNKAVEADLADRSLSSVRGGS